MIQCREAFKGTLACKDMRSLQLPLAGTAEQQPPYWRRLQSTAHPILYREMPLVPVQKPRLRETQAFKSFICFLKSYMVYPIAKVNEQITFLMFCSFCLIDCQERNFKGSTSHSGERVTFCCVFHVSKMQIYKGLGAFIQSLNFNIPQASNFQSSKESSHFMASHEM